MLHKLNKKKRGKQQLMPLKIYLFVGVVADQGKKKKKPSSGSQERRNRVARREWEVDISGSTSFDELLTQGITLLLYN